MANQASVPSPGVIDWTDWSKPGQNDVRSPCPAINALANHNILPHNGKGITKEMIVRALTTAYNLDPGIASVFASGAIAANPDHHAHTFDLNYVNKHGFIEHDSSLSREDVAFGSNSDFSPEIFAETFKPELTGNADTVDWKTAGKIRYTRVLTSKEKHDTENKTWTYGMKEAIMSYGETSLYMNLLGKAGITPLKWVHTFFEEERLPYDEGWRAPPKFDQSDLNHGYTEMLKSHEHGGEEAKLVGLGSLQALKIAVISLGALLTKVGTPRV